VAAGARAEEASIHCLLLIAELNGSSSFLVQTEAPKGEKSADFSEIETMLTFFVEARLGAF
jgi:hypothetical protein